MIKLIDLLLENNQRQIDYLTKLATRTDLTGPQYDKIYKEIELLKHLDTKSRKKIKTVNTISNIFDAGIKFAEDLSPRISKLDLEIVIADALKNESRKNLGFNPNGPNVEQFKIGICKKLFNQPTHPDSIPKQWLSLPWTIKEKIFVNHKTPVSVSGEILSKKEATEWLTSIAMNKKFGGEEWKLWSANPLSWITRYVNLKNHIPRSKLIADWISYQDKLKKGIFEVERIQHLPDGREIKFTYVDIIDEIQDQDLTSGIKTNVQRAFERASQRNTGDYINKLKKSNRVFPSFPFALHPNMTYLDTPQKLADEGCDMNHCVAGYADLALAGKVYIVSVKTDQGRSTVEIDSNGIIRQHRAKFNADPPTENKIIVNNWKPILIKK